MSNLAEYTMVVSIDRHSTDSLTTTWVLIRESGKVTMAFPFTCAGNALGAIEARFITTSDMEGFESLILEEERGGSVFDDDMDREFAHLEGEFPYLNWIKTDMNEWR